VSIRFEYSLWNVPVDADTDIPETDKWLFDTPFRTFPLDTEYDDVVRYVRTRQPIQPRTVGIGQTVSDVVIRWRTVKFGPYRDMQTPPDMSV